MPLCDFPLCKNKAGQVPPQSVAIFSRRAAPSAAGDNNLVLPDEERAISPAGDRAHFPLTANAADQYAATLPAYAERHSVERSPRG